MLDLSFLDQRLLLILSLLLLDFEVHVDFVLFRDWEISKVELLEVEVVPAQMALLALQNDRVVLIVGELVTKLDRIHSSCDDAALIHRVAVLGTREKVCVCLSDIRIETILEFAKNSRWQGSTGVIDP